MPYYWLSTSMISHVTLSKWPTPAASRWLLGSYWPISAPNTPALGNHDDATAAAIGGI